MIKMKLLYKHIILSGLLLTVLLVLLSGCIHEPYDIPKKPTDDNVLIEIFTRSYGYTTPVTRAAANENSIARELWFFVFEGSGNNAIFVEAVQSYEMLSKIYVNLKRTSVDTQLLILANTHNYNVIDFDSWVGVKNLSEVCSLLLTQPLTNPQTSVPYIGQSIPMSYLFPVPGGIKDNTTIGTGVSPLMLIRSLSKVVVENTESNFTLLGITEVQNVPSYGQYHNLSAPPMNVSTSDLIAYENTGTDIVVATNNTTEDNPLYIYESHKNNNSYIIINGEYMGNKYYYKMAFVDNAAIPSPVHLLRNHSYVYTINKVTGQGHDTVDEARMAPAYNNKIIDVTLTVEDLSAYETTAFNDYYLAVSNSYYQLYSNSNTGTAFTLYSHNPGAVSPTTIESVTTGISCTPNSFGTSTVTPVNVTFNGVSKGEIKITLGNLKKIITVEKYPLWPVNQINKTNTAGNFADWYCVSGTIATGADWIKLHPSSWTKPVSPANPDANDRNDTDNILVDDGIIQIERRSTGTGTGTIYLSSIKDPTGSVTQTAERIKIDIK